MILTNKKKWIIAGTVIGTTGAGVGIAVPLLLNNKHKESHKGTQTYPLSGSQTQTLDSGKLNIQNKEGDVTLKPNLLPHGNPVLFPTQVAVYDTPVQKLYIDAPTGQFDMAIDVTTIEVPKLQALKYVAPSVDLNKVGTPKPKVIESIVSETDFIDESSATVNFKNVSEQEITFDAVAEVKQKPSQLIGKMPTLKTESEVIKTVILDVVDPVEAAIKVVNYYADNYNEYQQDRSEYRQVVLDNREVFEQAHGQKFRETKFGIFITDPRTLQDEIRKYNNIK